MLVPRQEYSRELKIACMRELDSGKGWPRSRGSINSVPNGWRRGKASGVPKANWRFPAKVRVPRPDWTANALPYWSARSDSRPWRLIS
jgi:hypothetical protein